MLEVAATAIDLIESKGVSPRGNRLHYSYPSC